MFIATNYLPFDPLVLFPSFKVLYTTLSTLLQPPVDHGVAGPASKSAIKEAVQLLLDGVDYHPPSSDKQRKAFLYEIVCSEFSSYRHDPAWFETACRHAAKMAETCYQRHPHDAQVQTARFTWFILYLDDLCHKFPSSMENFQHSILSSQSPDQTVLSRFHEQLLNMYLEWDTIPANCIVSSAMEYVNGCVLEEFQAAEDMKISASAQSWPDYLRDKTGIAAAYAFMIFPRNPDYKVTDFIQTIGDIMIFINLANDVLSFYKEEKAGETGNYIHNRAYINGKSASDTLKDVSREVVAAYSRVSDVLQSQSPASYEMWKTFGPGYISCHIDVPRYRLSELGL